MNRPRTTRRLTHAGILAALPVLSLPLACETPGAAPAQQGEGDTPAATSAAAPVIIPTHNRFVRLARGLHPLARPEFDRGRLDPARRISNLSMFFDLTPEQRRDRDALAAAQLDPKSPQYHRWLTPEDYRARFGTPDEVLARGAAWLGDQGFDVHRTSRLGTRVTFSGTVAQLDAAFQTEMHEYVVRGESHYAMATAPAIPPDLAGLVLGIHNTHDFYKTPVSSHHNTEALEHQASPSYKFTFDAGADAGPDADSFNVLGPPDWATAYDVAKLYSPGIGGKALDGTGVTIGIVGTAEIAMSDVAAFRTLFNLPPPKVNMILVPDTGAAAAGRRGDGLEAILDVEWSGAIAKNATINYVFVGGSDRNVDDASFYLIEENLAPLMSESYGGCEQGSLPSDADILEENGTAANLLGITYMAAAGDSGAADCGGGEGAGGLYVDMPGSFPGVTSVGGTEFPNPSWTGDGGLISYPTETVWNESDDPYSQYGIGAGGGGISSVFARPAYQATISTCTPVGSLPDTESPSTMRQVPDVALSAASGTPGYLVVCTISGEDCSATGGSPDGIPIGGTSASSPSFTGVVAILNQALGERLGNINPLLYALQATPPSAYSAPFHDITQGNNEIVCGTAAQGDAGGPGSGGWPTDAGCGPSGLYGYAAGPGYDCASGIGSIDAFNLVNALIGVTATTTTLTVSPTVTTETQPVALTAKVENKTANPAAPTGSVTFTFESFTATGATDLSWELGSATVDAAGTATLSTTIPPGLVKPTDQFVDVVAVYGGDTKHLPSTSAKVGVGFEPIDFVVSPMTVKVAPSADQTFTSTGGTPPINWYIDEDTTSGRADGGTFGFANITEDGGVLTAGPKTGYIEISALDKYGAEAIAYVTVGSPTAASPWAADAGPFIDAAVQPVLADAAPAHEAGPKDAGTDVEAHKDSASPVDAHHSLDANDGGEGDAGPLAVSTGGCRCSLVGGAAPSDGSSPPAGLAGLALGLAFVARRRRRG